ncbi:hypothetical protein NPX13_g8086 [Xylaria arbuscula]|uniref:Uncharacterized protein n=1 Tax=Xylaria arbuscula TaxID=114810 RepID=A0A9W8N9E9_9PEZI|nr:hypothetical protein NPX13_g8086 [Xylaria arbuscula]
MGEHHHHHYAATYPTGGGLVAVDERVKTFISAFYAVSDDPGRNREWVEDYFVPDACLVMGNKKVQGVEVKSRRHKLDKVFPAVFEQLEKVRRFEYMLHGTVDLEMKSGERTTGQWAGRAVLGDDEERGGLS